MGNRGRKRPAVALPTFSASSSSVGVSRADHMETSEPAIGDLASVLLRPLARSCLAPGVPAAELRLWDPYYCQGSVKSLYARHGFPLCHNEREDFYEVIKRKGGGVASSLPPHDVLVTNPPYSGQHIERALWFCARNGDVPWAMLIPSHVLARPWWAAMAVQLQRGGRAAPPMFLAPSERRYEFDNCYDSEGAEGGSGSSTGAVDADVKCKGKGKGKGKAATVAPLETIWFIGGLTAALATVLRSQATITINKECVLATGLKELPRRIRKVHVYAQRRAASKGAKKGKGKGNESSAKRRRKGDDDNNATAGGDTGDSSDGSGAAAGEADGGGDVDVGNADVMTVKAETDGMTVKAERQAKEGPDWDCAGCANVNWGRRECCNRCKMPRGGEAVAAAKKKKNKKKRKNKRKKQDMKSLK